METQILSVCNIPQLLFQLTTTSATPLIDANLKWQRGGDALELSLPTKFYLFSSENREKQLLNSLWQQNSNFSSANREKQHSLDAKAPRCRKLPPLTQWSLKSSLFISHLWWSSKSRRYFAIGLLRSLCWHDIYLCINLCYWQELLEELFNFETCPMCMSKWSNIFCEMCPIVNISGGV